MSYKNTKTIDETLDQSCKHARILIVEDDPNYRFFLKQTLAKQGYTNIEQAANGNEGYHKTLTFKPHMVVLDLMMPICNGIEYCERIRALPEFSDMPILVQTGIGDLEMHKKSFQAGATDLLTKPVNPEEFLARTQAHLERYELSRNMNDYRDILRQELDVADSMQRYFMPSNKYCREIEQSFGLCISSYYQSSGLVGGDMWNALALDENRLLIYACDFSTQGISSAIQSLRYHTLMQRFAGEYNTPADIVRRLNTHLFSILEEEQNTLLFVAILDIASGTMEFCGAGVPGPLVLNAEQGRMETLPAKNPPLGVTPEIDYSNLTTRFESGDSLFLYSDALFSTCRNDGTCLTEEEVATMASDCLMATSIEEKHKAFHACMCHNIVASNATLADDLLMLLVSKV